METENLTETEASLRALGVQADAGEEYAAPASRETSEAAPQADKVETEAQTSEAAQVQPPAKGDEKSEKSADTTADKPEPKSKFAKERDRVSKTWQEINAEKEALKREREEFEQARTSAKPAEPQPFKDSEGYSAKEYAAAATRAAEDAKALRAKAKEAMDSFDDAAAEELKAKAAEADAWAQRYGARANEVQQAENQQLAQSRQTAWNRHLQEMAKEEPDVAADLAAGKAQSPLGLAIEKVLKEMPGLIGVPDGSGILLARRIAKGDYLAAAVPALKKQIEEKDQEIKRLTELTSIPASGPAKRASGESSDLNERDLRRLAEEADSAAA